MSKSNKINLIGNVGKDPETKVLPSGAEFAKFSIATTNNYKDKTGEWQQETTWHNCIAWNKAASQITSSVKKGSYLMIEGELSYNEWTDKHGQKRRDAEIKVDTIYFLSKPKRAESVTEADVVDSGNSEDVPF